MCIRKVMVLLLASVATVKLSFAQIKEVEFEALDSLQKIEKRLVVVFLHTSWCRYCGVMANSTFKDKAVAQLISERFYFVPLDLEEKKDVSFRGYTFKYKPTGATTGVHELAEQLGTINGAISYPAVCFLNADYEIIYQREGFIKAEDFLDMLKRLKQ